jgi:hypothetical protein
MAAMRGLVLCLAAWGAHAITKEQGVDALKKIEHLKGIDGSDLACDACLLEVDCIWRETFNMKDLIRQRISILPEMMDLLNNQIKQEQQASSSYLAMASWCDQNGFINSAKLFYAQSEEEREHMMKIFTYVVDNGGSPISPSIDPVNHSFLSLTDVFHSALDMDDPGGAHQR